VSKKLKTADTDKMSTKKEDYEKAMEMHESSIESANVMWNEVECVRAIQAYPKPRGVRPRHAPTGHKQNTALHLHDYVTTSLGD